MIGTAGGVGFNYTPPEYAETPRGYRIRSFDVMFAAEVYDFYRTVSEARIFQFLTVEARRHVIQGPIFEKVRDRIVWGMIGAYDAGTCGFTIPEEMLNDLYFGFAPRVAAHVRAMSVGVFVDRGAMILLHPYIAPGGVLL